MTLILTGSPTRYGEDRFTEDNGFLATVKAELPPRPRVLLVSAAPDDKAFTDSVLEGMSLCIRNSGIVCSGITMLDRIASIKEKSEMKKYYAAGNIPTARQIKAAEGLKAVLAFTKKTGYPIIAKPDNGVGASGTFKMNSDEELKTWFAEHESNYGAFVVEEFFQLDRDREGLGKKGDYVGLEVNMRPPGGYTPDMMNFAHSIDVFQIWADMVAFDERRKGFGEQYYCAYASRRDCHSYKRSHQEILAKYGADLCMCDRMPAALADALGDQVYIARFSAKKDIDPFFRFVCEQV